MNIYKIKYSILLSNEEQNGFLGVVVLGGGSWDPERGKENGNDRTPGLTARKKPHKLFFD